MSGPMDERVDRRAEPAGLAGLIERARRFIVEDLWHMDLRPHTWTASGARLLQLAVMIARGFVRDELLLRASALTYVTTLSLMPLLVVTVALIGLVGGQETIIDAVVDQLTAVSPDARDLILERLRGTRIGSLGTLGGSLLLVTAVLALRHLETTLNDIWGIRQGRSWMRRFADYLAVLIVAPLLMATAVSLQTTLQSGRIFEELLQLPFFQFLYDSGLRHLPQVLLVVAFTFLYWFFPNTSVRPLSAILGAVVAAILFSAARYVYVDLSVGAARYSVLFGGMVALPLILAWLYVCWAVVLLGAEVAFAHQNLKHYRREVRGVAQLPAEREALGLRIGLAVARCFAGHAPPPTAAELSESLDVSVRGVRELLDALEAEGLIVQCAGDDSDPAYVPARPLADTTVADVLGAIRGSRRGAEPEEGEEPPSVRPDRAVAQILGRIDRAVAELGEAHTLADLLAAGPPAGPEEA